MIHKEVIKKPIMENTKSSWIVRDRPGSSWDRPGSSWDRPGSSWDRPGSSWDRPGSSWDRPGSSRIVLGSSGRYMTIQDDIFGGGGPLKYIYALLLLLVIVRIIMFNDNSVQYSSFDDLN